MSGSDQWARPCILTRTNMRTCVLHLKADWSETTSEAVQIESHLSYRVQLLHVGMEPDLIGHLCGEVTNTYVTWLVVAGIKTDRPSFISLYCFCRRPVWVMSLFVTVTSLLLFFVVPCHGCDCVVYDFPEKLCSISKSYGESKCQVLSNRTPLKRYHAHRHTHFSKVTVWVYHLSF